MLGGIDLKGDDADLFSDGPDENQPAADKVQPAADEVQFAADEVQSVDKPAADDASPTVSASPIVVPTSPQISETLHQYGHRPPPVLGRRWRQRRRKLFVSLCREIGNACKNLRRGAGGARRERGSQPNDLHGIRCRQRHRGVGSENVRRRGRQNLALNTAGARLLCLAAVDSVCNIAEKPVFLQYCTRCQSQPNITIAR